MRIVRPLLAVALALWTLAGSAPADEPQAPRGRDEVADAVQAAVAAGDEETLHALAALEVPSPWVVADELYLRGDLASAEALASAATGPATEKLADYVRTLRGVPPDATLRSAIARARTALTRGDAPGALSALAEFTSAPPTVGGVGLLLERAWALRGAGRFGESRSAFEAAAESARRLGWLSQAAGALIEAGVSAWHADDATVMRDRSREALALAEAIGSDRLTATALENLAQAYRELGDYARALPAARRAVALWEPSGDSSNLAVALREAGVIQKARGEFPEARALLERAVALFESLGDETAWANALNSLGNVLEELGETSQSVALKERALDTLRRLKESRGVAVTLTSLARAYLDEGRTKEAREALEEALTIDEKLGLEASLPWPLIALGNVYVAAGQLQQAAAHYRRALALARAGGRRSMEAAALDQLGDVSVLLGDYPAAFRHYAEAQSLFERLGAPMGVAGVLNDLAGLYSEIGDQPRARALATRLRDFGVEHQFPLGAANAWLLIGCTYALEGDWTKAREATSTALAAYEEIEDAAGVANALNNLGLILEREGEPKEALDRFARARDLARSRGLRALAARLSGNVARAQAASGQHEESVASLERAVAETRRMRLTFPLVVNLTNLTLARLWAGENQLALQAAGEARREMEDLLGGLAEEEGSLARGQHALVFAGGALAAARLGNVRELSAFLESGRAGSLLESLGGRQALRWADLPEDLRNAEADAKELAARARHAYQLSIGTGRVREIHERATALDEALDGLRGVNARIQREAKRQAGLFYPRAATLEEIEGWLPKGTALVLYSLPNLGQGFDNALALVLTHAGERVVDLGAAGSIRHAAEAFDGADPETDVTEALDRLRAALVEPLALGDDVKTVLVSPEGALCYVPFGALFEGRPVALVPSGTTYVLLRDEERQPGEGVLALGDPDYGHVDAGAAEIYRRGARLVPLPETREEANAVGDTVLLGKDATEAGLREALAKRRRWRAVHLACHGLVDVERPMLSSLALAPGGEDDGFLTALEVLRMEIPADLAVLSACETGKGKVVKGEGIVGLTRAFMYAGSPRVICSLWEVPDEATRALMTKFYALWHPKEGEGLGAAEALREAQAYVRAQPGWSHPHYWAAWVLWGLPE